MIELNKTYVKKENKNVKVIPCSEMNSVIEFREVGFFNPRLIPTEIFLERFELEKEE